MFGMPVSIDAHTTGWQRTYPLYDENGDCRIFLMIENEMDSVHVWARTPWDKFTIDTDVPKTEELSDKIDVVLKWFGYRIDWELYRKD